jgi:hypothetical protein
MDVEREHESDVLDIVVKAGYCKGRCPEHDLLHFISISLVEMNERLVEFARTVSLKS